MLGIYLTKVNEKMQGSNKTVIILLSAIFWLAAIGYSLQLGNLLRYPDERWYFNDYAQNLANLHIFGRDNIHPTAFHPPGYPLFLGMLVGLGFGVTAARLMNFLVLFFTLVCLFSCLEDCSHKLAALLAVMLSLGYPVLFYTAGTLYPQTFGSFFFILAIWLYWKQSLTTRNAILAGLALGIAVLTIPTFLFVPIFLILFSILFRKEALVNTGLLFLMVFIAIAPWTVRNYLVFNRFELISSNFGTNFLIGNSPATTSNNGPAAAVGITGIVDKANRLGLDEFERDEFYTKQALMFIQQDPKHYITLYFLKVANYFNFRNELLTASESSLAKDLLMLFTYGSFLLAAIFRVLLFKKYPFSKLEIFLLLLYISSAFVSALAFTRIRYRLPFDYLLIGFVAVFVEKLFIQRDKVLLYEK